MVPFTTLQLTQGTKLTRGWNFFLSYFVLFFFLQISHKRVENDGQGSRSSFSVDLSLCDRPGNHSNSSEVTRTCLVQTIVCLFGKNDSIEIFHICDKLTYRKQRQLNSFQLKVCEVLYIRPIIDLPWRCGQNKKSSIPFNQQASSSSWWEDAPPFNRKI